MSIQKTQVLNILPQGQTWQAFKNAAAEPGSRNLVLTATLFNYVSTEAEAKCVSPIATNQHASVIGDLCSEPLPCWRKIKFPSFLDSTRHTPSSTYLRCSILQTEVFASTQKKKRMTQDDK